MSLICSFIGACLFVVLYLIIYDLLLWVTKRVRNKKGAWGKGFASKLLTLDDLFLLEDRELVWVEFKNGFYKTVTPASDGWYAVRVKALVTGHDSFALTSDQKPSISSAGYGWWYRVWEEKPGFFERKFAKW